MILHLPSITLLAIDVVKPFHTLHSLRHTLLWCRFREAILLTDVRKHTGIGSQARAAGVTVINHTQSAATHKFPGIARVFYPDYEMAVLAEPAKLVGDSTHILYMERDAGVLNPGEWNTKWLGYDFIGAPWPLHSDPGWPPCTVGNNVGNSGFSLRSAKFCKAVAELAEQSEDSARFSNDSWTGRTMRPVLTELGIKYAPDKVADRFSCENQIYSGQFGFHGRHTIELNGWGGWFKDVLEAEEKYVAKI